MPRGRGALLIEVRLRVAEGVAGNDEIGRCDGNSGDADAFERGGEETRAEAFTEDASWSKSSGDATMDWRAGTAWSRSRPRESSSRVTRSWAAGSRPSARNAS